MGKIFPILLWIKDYQLRDLKGDALAGITVGTMLIPQGMAYAMLAGLPPIAGLYASLVPLMLYPIFGTSRKLSVGPVAMDSLLVAAGVGAMAESGTDQYWAYAMLLAVMVGIIQLSMGVLRLGFLVNFLSQPLINGFTSAAAIIIGLSQVKHLFRIEFEGSQQVHIALSRIFDEIQHLHTTSLLLGLGCIALLLFLGKWKPGWPGGLIAVILSILVVYGFSLDEVGVSVVGTVPEGLPTFQLPNLDWELIRTMLPIAFALALISYMEGIAIAKKLATQEGQPISANQELVAIGASNFSAGLFGGYPIAGSLSRTAVNKNTGAVTPLSSVFNALTIALTLLFLTPLFYYMPKAVLASIVIVAVTKLIDIKEPLRLFHVRKVDFIVLMFSFLITLLLGAQRGILLGAVISIVLIIKRISYPNVAILGRVNNTDEFRNIRAVKEAREIPGYVFFRMDASLYYANVSYMETNIMKAIQERDGLHTFVFDFSSVNEIDATAIASLSTLVSDLKAKGIKSFFTRVKTPVREIMSKSGFLEQAGQDAFLFDNKDVINARSVTVDEGK